MIKMWETPPEQASRDTETNAQVRVPQVGPIAVSMREAARISGLSRSFLYEEIKRQRLKSVRKRGRRLILIEDLNEYLCARD